MGVSADEETAEVTHGSGRLRSAAESAKARFFRTKSRRENISSPSRRLQAGVSARAARALERGNAGKCREKSGCAQSAAAAKDRAPCVNPTKLARNGAKRLARGMPEAPPRTTRSATAVDIARGAATDHGTAEAARFSAFLSAMVTENRSAAAPRAGTLDVIVAPRRSPRSSLSETRARTVDRHHTGSAAQFFLCRRFLEDAVSELNTCGHEDVTYLKVRQILSRHEWGIAS